MIFILKKKHLRHLKLHPIREFADGLHLDICFVFLVGWVIFSKTYEEHEERLEKKIFQRLREVNFKLLPTKCDFLKKKIKYVQNMVSEKRKELHQDKINKVHN